MIKKNSCEKIDYVYFKLNVNYAEYAVLLKKKKHASPTGVFHSTRYISANEL